MKSNKNTLPILNVLVKISKTNVDNITTVINFVVDPTMGKIIQTHLVEGPLTSRILEDMLPMLLIEVTKIMSVDKVHPCDIFGHSKIGD